MTVRPLRTLRARLRERVLVPLALVTLASGAAVLTVAWESTSQALDRSLLDDAYAIAAHVSADDGELHLDLTERELGTALFDHRERLFFSVFDHRGRLIAGNAHLARTEPATGSWAFAHQELDGEPLRTVTLRRGAGLEVFTVTIAQTTFERRQWLGRLAASALLPQLVLLPILGWWFGRIITEEVTPLDRLQRAVDQRDSNDLSPVDDAAPSREVTSLARALNRLMGRVADGVAAQREFAGNVAHELRTPLAGIRALAAYGLSHHDPEVWRRQLEAIASSEARASRLVEQLLALAYADEVQAAVALEPLAIDELVRDALLRYLPLADREGVELGASGLDQPVRALGSLALVEGALGNLIHNALRHGRPDDGRPATLTVEVARDADGVRIAVADNGRGIEPGERARLLQRWSRTAEGGGSGLGLAIAARYAELMGGRLTLDAAPGGGLVAELRLQAVAEAVTAA
ncbi:sensor histidine kinase [Piscinibacter koreensis]|uniref:histidine kinase n=1 Tax=Piscinibacter koreensis TaxID=2742824 RepID=A0A7Y6NJV8_9BURK|nr:sensor histidine kinase N-terminal domain-containing protein [Schlegelella koreensis]NUZ04515.1 sensor histidine kinase N-terminal domain-containing protein [Schlegelella koreensis]